MARTLVAAMIAAMVATLAASTAFAATNPLLGTWQSFYRGRDASSSLIYYITFSADGQYKTQVIFGTNRQGKGSGMAIILGRYTITGASTYDYWETRYLICPAMQYCNDYPPGDAAFGSRKSSSFTVRGDGSISAGGLTWTRVQ